MESLEALYIVREHLPKALSLLKGNGSEGSISVTSNHNPFPMVISKEYLETHSKEELIEGLRILKEYI